ncbi:MAG TPA: DUF4149 domain-containing protein [Roseovarius sp.]|uniref:DUF4149 domain-containing protein n=1 Tax=Marivita sp. TaxID=2003365 RepID=UPI0025C4F06F|nr:DUF4149 domain-containing protein [Marivita sp.]HKL44754.1 DUF4149 domain-containing protein [Roseovarius sp.]
MTTLALLSSALLFGGMVLYSFGFAAFLFTALPAETAGPTIRRAFPHFYLFVIAGAALSAALLAPSDPVSAMIMAAIALSTLPTRQLLMPAINAATDAGNKRRFGVLHGASVGITLIHIIAAAYVLHRFIG